MKKILGLDLGTNSIGWAVLNAADDNSLKYIEAAGSRIIPMDAAILGDFDRGNSISQTAERTRIRGMRHLRERYLLRRARLHRILNLLGFLPFHYAQDIDRYGNFSADMEPKIAWCKNLEGELEFIFIESFNEMLEDFRKNQPELVADNKKVPYDWVIYYLRKKALEKKISKEELAWILLNFNQKRGYYQLRGEDDDESMKTAKTRQYFDKQIIKNIIDTNQTYKGQRILIVELQNGDKGKIFKKELILDNNISFPEDTLCEDTYFYFKALINSNKISVLPNTQVYMYNTFEHKKTAIHGHDIKKFNRFLKGMYNVNDLLEPVKLSHHVTIGENIGSLLLIFSNLDKSHKMYAVKEIYKFEKYLNCKIDIHRREIAVLNNKVLNKQFKQAIFISKLYTSLYNNQTIKNLYRKFNIRKNN